MTTRRLTKRRERLEQRQLAVLHDLGSGMRQVDVAAKYKVSREAVSAFVKRHSDSLESMAVQVIQQAEDYAIAQKIQRIAALQDRWDRMKALIDARAADTRYSDEPGYETGLMVHQLKAVGRGEDFQLVDLYVTDAQLLAEMRATERAVAEEMAQIQRPDMNVNIKSLMLVRNIDGGDESVS